MIKRRERERERDPAKLVQRGVFSVRREQPGSQFVYSLRVGDFSVLAGFWLQSLFVKIFKLTVTLFEAKQRRFFVGLPTSGTQCGKCWSSLIDGSACTKYTVKILHSSSPFFFFLKNDSFLLLPSKMQSRKFKPCLSRRWVNRKKKRGLSL